MADVLVVYFSVTGHTETVARALAARLGAEIEVIRPQASYAGFVGAVRGMWQHFSRSGPRLSQGRSPAAYALVAVGGPVWCGHLSAPVRSYLSLYAPDISRLAGFWVSRSGQAYAGLAQEMAQLAQAPVATLALSDAEVKNGRFDDRLAEFAAALATRGGSG